MEKQKVPQLNNDVYEKILEKVVELEVEDLNTFVSLRGTKWNCRNDCHGVQAFYAINVPSRSWKNHDWPVECRSPLDKIINHTNVIYKPAVLRFSWIVPLVNFAMALNDTQREIFRKFEVSFYVDCHYTNTIDGCTLANSHHSHRTSPSFIYKLIDEFDKNDERLKKYCWHDEPACICYMAQLHEELICKSYH